MCFGRRIAVDLNIELGLKNSLNRNKTVVEAVSASIPSGSRKCLLARRPDPYWMDLCTNPSFYDKLLFYDLVRNETISEARLALAQPDLSNKKKLDKLYKIGFEVGGNILNRLWVPKPTLQNHIESVYERFFKDNYVIGFHVRRVHLGSDSTLDAFIDCGYMLERAVRVGALTYNKVKLNSLSNWFFIFKDLEKVTTARLCLV